MSHNPKKIISKVESLFHSTERKNAEAQWKNIAEFILPLQSGLFLGSAHATGVSSGVNSTPGAKKTDRLMDSTAVQANRDLAAAMHTALTNPATKWSKIAFEEDTFNNNPETVEWLEQVSSIIHKTINESNFDTEVSKCYPMYTAFGNMSLLLDPKFDQDNNFIGIKAKSLHLANVVWEEDEDGMVDSFYRKISFTAEQAFSLFGEKAGNHVIKTLEKDPNKEFSYLHCVFKRNKNQVKVNSIGEAAPENRPYASLYINTEEAVVSLEDGYYDFPLATGRYDLNPAERYARGPGHVAIPDVRSLNQLRREELAAAGLANRPPLEVVQRDIMGTLDIRPGGLNTVRTKGAITPIALGANPDGAFRTQEKIIEQIKKVFFLDKLLLPPRNEIGEMTAAEVRQRAEEIQRVFGPTLGRLNNEFLEPIVLRVFSILFRNGALPELPPQLAAEGVNVEIKFINQFAKSQQLEDVSNQLGYLQEIAQIAQLSPEILDIINFDAMGKGIGKQRGISEAVIRNEDEVEAIREQRAQQAQQQQMLAAGQQMADIESKIK
jgi:hypothetical protein